MEDENKEVIEETTDTIEKDEVKNEEVNVGRFEKEIELPSNGYLGGPKKVTIRAMTTAEEKILYSTRDFSFVKKICKACTVKPKVLDLSTVTPEDLRLMLFQIREVTFGPTYLQPIKCPNCGMVQDAEINIADFEYTLLDEDISSKLFITLPINKDQVHLRLLSQNEHDVIEDASYKLFNEGKIKDPDGYSMVKKVAAMIESVSGVEFKNDNDKYSYVNGLHLADFNKIRNTLDSVEYGLKNVCKIKCNNCEEEVEVNGTICPEFFRPTK